jgi:hypothetical protein
MAKAHRGRAKRNRGCGLCKPHRKAGNGGKRWDRTIGAVKPDKHRTIWIVLA